MEKEASLTRVRPYAPLFVFSPARRDRANECDLIGGTDSEGEIHRLHREALPDFLPSSIQQHIEMAVCDAEPSSDVLLDVLPREAAQHVGRNDGAVGHRLIQPGSAGTDGGGLLQIKPRLWKMITRREGLGIDTPVRKRYPDEPRPDPTAPVTDQRRVPDAP